MADPENPVTEDGGGDEGGRRFRVLVGETWKYADDVLVTISRNMDTLGDRSVDADLFTLGQVVKATCSNIGLFASVVRQVIEQLGVPYNWPEWAGDMESESPGAGDRDINAIFRGFDTLLGRWKSPHAP